MDAVNFTCSRDWAMCKKRHGGVQPPFGARLGERRRAVRRCYEKLGLDRAEAVKRYLYQQHQIPLHRISVISYGSEKPIAPNTTKAGRAQNRRVVIKVLV
jgi:hypothetical protein